ncbi:MAG TPA: NAD-glutamate dehydrogenase [Thermoanaerobaculia bacterium]|nr:NAD-glutamate dehydrogenase [Thermoanaerobaculia bacterium]
MLITEERQTTERIERTAALAGERAGGARRDEIERFVSQMYANVPPDDLLRDTPENLAGAALALWRFAEERAPGGPVLRHYKPADEGWESPYSIVEIVNDDRPFLLDSVVAELHRRHAEVHLAIHPIVAVRRDETGRLLALPASPEGADRESLMQIRIDARSAGPSEEILQGLRAVLEDVRVIVEDFKAMAERCGWILDELELNPPPLPAAEIEVGLQFLRWLADKNFTYLGYRKYSFEGEGETAVARVVPDTGCGLLRDEAYAVFDGLRNLGRLPEDVRDFLRRPDLVRITKSNRLSTVHKSVPMDAVAIKTFDEYGKVTGERLFIGLFTAAAYNCSPLLIPLLKEKIEGVLARGGFSPNSYNGKNLRYILETYPRDELFQISEDELFHIAMGILHLQERLKVAVFVRRDPFLRSVSCLVFLPRDRYNTGLRQVVEQILAEAYGGTAKTVETRISASVLVRLYIQVDGHGGRVGDADAAEVQKLLEEATRSWFDRLHEALAARHDEEESLRLGRRYAKAFPARYEADVPAEAAVTDIQYLEEALTTDGLAENLFQEEGGAPWELRLKLYGLGEEKPLSDILPMLESMGVRVQEEIPYQTSPSGVDQRLWIRDFRMKTEDGRAFDLAAVRQAFHDTFESVWRGEIENDGFNKLVLRAGLVGREVMILRACCKYLRQAQIPFSQAYMEETLAKNPGIARALVDLFLETFDPQRAGARSAAIREETGHLLEKVRNLDEDRILRRFLNLIEATLRTNYFQTGTDGRPKGYLSIKIDSQALEDLPKPRPFREVFVYSPRVEAIHLRGGRVARGGIRWSDRREDFRTEVLGLMKTQMVKNSVIVPVGSKGGFVVKRPPAPEAGREAYQQEGIECYKTLMRGLLDVTDNLVGDAVVPPRDVVRRDDNDPYLVVAADKGTATFSDIANGISEEYGFWLGDAFASGGSSGYDHKEMAITSRGVWEGVRRHFRELDPPRDVEREELTCAGIGDMSGDVFGNGLLRSRCTKLVAAFDHRHIFIDPAPDPGRSYEERLRLFQLPRSSWADYDASLISPGGGVFERTLRSIPVSPEMAQLFGLSVDQLTPGELIQAILRSPVDLFFFGGIGTFVKASAESHADAKDRTNDAMRVDARELRARVIGEGANLALTQRARIEYSQMGGPDGTGGRLNTDFIDNSAGVDCSDHEVNIKILLNAIEREGRLARDDRDRLLVAMTDEVGHLVLRDNYLQTQAISVTHALGYHMLDRQARFMRVLEREGRIDRRLEVLPDEDELAERARLHLGFTRPELSVLLAYAKIALYDELLASDLPDDPVMQEDLKLYFPTRLRELYPGEIGYHRLHREIIATAATNSIVNRTGVSFVHEVKERTGERGADIARAYVITREVFKLRTFWADVEALDNVVPAHFQALMLTEGGRLIDRATTWFLREAGRPLDIGSQIAACAPGVQEVAENLDGLLSPSDRAQLGARIAGLTAKGVPAGLARRAASLVSWLAPALDIVRIARELGFPPLRVGRFYFAAGDRFGFDRTREAAAKLSQDKALDKLAITAMTDDLASLQAQLTRRILETVNGQVDPDAAITAWVEGRRPAVTRAEHLMAELRTVETPTLAMMVVANRALRAMTA